MCGEEGKGGKSARSEAVLRGLACPMLWASEDCRGQKWKGGREGRVRVPLVWSMEAAGAEAVGAVGVSNHPPQVRGVWREQTLLMLHGTNTNKWSLWNRDISNNVSIHTKIMIFFFFSFFHPLDLWISFRNINLMDTDLFIYSSNTIYVNWIFVLLLFYIYQKLQIFRMSIYYYKIFLQLMFFPFDILYLHYDTLNNNDSLCVTWKCKILISYNRTWFEKSVVLVYRNTCCFAAVPFYYKIH